MVCMILITIIKFNSVNNLAHNVDFTKALHNKVKLAKIMAKLPVEFTKLKSIEKIEYLVLLMFSQNGSHTQRDHHHSS